MNHKEWKAQVYFVAFIFFIIIMQTVEGRTNSNFVPITVVSVSSDKEMPITPAGPLLNITLKSNSSVPITNLSATLTASDFFITEGFYLIPNRVAFSVKFPDIPNINQTVCMTVLIRSADFESNTTYPLIIDGTLKNGKAFSYVFPMMMESYHYYSLIPVSAPILKGDVNGDGQVTVVDALFIAQYTVGIRTLTFSQLATADVNNDGQVTVADALFIAQYTV